jgi:hypothetical protein
MGRFLMNQARAAWRDATDAHREAAAKIEAATNSSSKRGLWELDLHGLHASEVCPQVGARGGRRQLHALCSAQS